MSDKWVVAIETEYGKFHFVMKSHEPIARIGRIHEWLMERNIRFGVPPYGDTRVSRVHDEEEDKWKQGITGKL